MMKLEIFKLYRNTTRKDGSPYKDKNGKPFELVTVYADNKQYTTIDYDGWTKEWREEDTITVEIEEVEKDGKVYLNIRNPNRKPPLAPRIEKLEERMDRAAEIMAALIARLEKLENKDIPTDLPFDNL